jgi:hypothetical protein
MMSRDIDVEHPQPPDDELLVGKSAGRGLWQDIARELPRARVPTEEWVVRPDPCVALLRYELDELLRVTPGTTAAKLP